MLKVIIIDDESLVRVGLKSMIHWEELGYEMIGEASNGQQGLDLLVETKPDIVISDIKMPVMDGLEMMRQALKMDLKPEFIILSGYNEFNLVKQAMKQGAAEYLIKLDLEPDILVNVLDTVREKIRQEREQIDQAGWFTKSLRENLAVLREDFFKQMIHRPLQNPSEISERVKNLTIDLDDCALGVFLVKLNDASVLEKYDSSELGVLEVSLINIVNEIVDDTFKGYTFTWNQGEFIGIFSGSGELSAAAYHEKAWNMADRLVQVIKQYFNFEVIVAISKLHQGYQELAQAYFESCRAVQDSFYGHLEPVVFFREIFQDHEEQEFVELKDMKAKIPRAIELFQLEDIRQFFKSAYSILAQQIISRSRAYELCFQIVYSISSADNLNETDIKVIFGRADSFYENILKLNTLPEMMTWLLNLEQNLCHFLSKNEEQKNNRLISKAKKFIMEHYEEEISLAEVAMALNISPGYFSTLFRQYTGMCFTDYVTENKIDHAKKLLRETDLKIYEVSNRLGYQSAYYFSKVFKKVTGMTPREFSDKNC
jgi:two-component system, response regulator YesN